MTEQPKESESPRLLTQKAAAAYVGVSVPTFAKWVAAGLFPPSVSITKMWDKKAIDAQLDKLSGLEVEPSDDGGYERRRLERDAKKAAKVSLVHIGDQFTLHTENSYTSPSPILVV